MRAGVYSLAFLLGTTLISSGGCGGDSAGGGTLPPPPQPDFSLALSVSSLSIAQGNSSAPVMISITGLNGFSGSVQIALSGIPTGVTTNLAAPFSVSAGENASIIFGAVPNAATGQFNLSAQGTSGSLSHSASFSLTVQPAAVSNLPRSTFLRNDSVAAVDTPSGEPRRRQIVFDSAGSRFFVANPAMNRVEIYSDSFPLLQSTIDAPGASSVDLSPDGSTLWVGTVTAQLLAVSTANLQVQSRYPMAGFTPIPGEVFNQPEEALALSGGKLALRLRQSSAGESLLALWDPFTNMATNLTSLAPAVFQNGLGVMTHSDDRTRLLATSNDASGELVLLDGNANVVAGPQSIGSGAISSLVANANGSSFAAIINVSGAESVVLLNAQLAPIATYATTNAAGLVFSPGGETLYVSEALGNGSVITALAAANLQKIGQVSDLAVQGIPTAIEEIDASQFVWGRGNRGIGIIDVSSPGLLSAPAPVFANAPSALPAEGPNTGGTSITFFGTNFPSSAFIRFGTQSPLTANVAGTSQLQIASPPSATSGATNLLAYFSNGWIVAAPSGFSYGPTVQEILPNVGTSAGGDTVYLIGQGFGTSAGAITATIGGQSATVQNVEALLPSPLLSRSTSPILSPSSASPSPLPQEPQARPTFP